MHCGAMHPGLFTEFEERRYLEVFEALSLVLEMIQCLFDAQSIIMEVWRDFIFVFPTLLARPMVLRVLPFFVCSPPLPPEERCQAMTP